jgi:hypothetical protein
MASTLAGFSRPVKRNCEMRAPAKKGGDKVGLTKKGKGTKWMLVIDANGLPLGFHLDSATTAEVRLAETTLDTISVVRPRGRPRQRPEKLGQIARMIIVHFVVCCAAVAWGCVSHRSDAQPRGDPSKDAQCWSGVTSIASAIRWSAASLGWATFAGCSFAGNTSVACIKGSSRSRSCGSACVGSVRPMVRSGWLRPAVSGSYHWPRETREEGARAEHGTERQPIWNATSTVSTSRSGPSWRRWA